VIKLGFQFVFFKIYRDLGRNNSAKTKYAVSRCQICSVRSESQRVLFRSDETWSNHVFSEERRERKNS